MTPEAIESLLSDFRSWLGQVAEAPAVPEAEVAEPIDLHTLLAQFTALRHEVNLQTRAVRAQQEQNAETLQQLTQALEELAEARAEIEKNRQQGRQQAEEETLRPLLKTLVDLNDSLSLAGREVQRLQDTIWQCVHKTLAAPEPAPSPAPAPPTEHWVIRNLKRFFPDRPGPEIVLSPQPVLAEQGQQTQAEQAADRLRQLLDSLLTGYTMSLQRMERTLRQQGLEPIPTVGESFDPEQMEVVEAVAGSGKPAGEVVGEVRRGYLWRGRVFRYAQVRVAKD